MYMKQIFLQSLRKQCTIWILNYLLFPELLTSCIIQLPRFVQQQMTKTNKLREIDRNRFKYRLVG